MKNTIEITLNNTSKITVECEIFLENNIALHKTIGSEIDYSVTHVKSGMRFHRNSLARCQLLISDIEKITSPSDWDFNPKEGLPLELRMKMNKLIKELPYKSLSKMR